MQKISVTLMEPKAGLLNVLGIPRAIVSEEFAKTQFIPLQNLEDLPFDHLVSDDATVLETLGPEIKPNNNDHIEITYVQGRVTDLKSKSADYVLNNNGKKSGKIEFNYVVLAMGRNRQWPTSPLAHNFDSYMQEMLEFNTNIRQCKLIAIIGAGAVGIEIAGDIKNMYQDLEVYLIHPHDTFPPEPLPEDFKAAVRKSLEDSGVKVMTGYRVKSELEDNVLEFHNGQTLRTDYNYWCNTFKNNVDILAKDLVPFVDENLNIKVNKYLQPTDEHKTLRHMFAIGDLVDLPIIKSAGWALYMGRQCARNIVSMIFDDELVEQMPDLSQMPKGMVLVAGNHDLISSLDGSLEVNNKGFVEEYKDYCIGKIRVTLGA